jgi:(2Fe-2S) ferredoxin
VTQQTYPNLEGEEAQSSVDLLRGTVKLYERHLYVCTGRDDWAAHIEEHDAYLAALAAALSQAQGSLARPVKLSACDAPSGRLARAEAAYDLLIFPDGLRYTGVTPADFPTLIADHLVGDRPSPRLASEPLTGRHLFVCVHQRRDARCGAWGPLLVERLGRELADRNFGQSVHVHRSSHIGGHRFAGNVIVYPEGDWYGLVRPDDIPELLEQHVQRGELVRRLWRGRMGLTPDEQIALAAGWAGDGVE